MQKVKKTLKTSEYEYITLNQWFHSLVLWNELCDVKYTQRQEMI